MSQQLHNELKKEFQLERMILFSDAVFAIAITILVIEIRVPEIPKELVTEQKLLQSLDHLIPKFVGFLISFMIIGLYWQVHHRMFGFVVNYTRRTLWLNLFFLLAVVLMPFSTAFYSEYVLRLLKTPIIVYVLNICFLGFMNFFLWKHLTNPKLNLTGGVTREEDVIFSFRSIAVPVVFYNCRICVLF
jgi:TMEM175 potassium channel family protein